MYKQSIPVLQCEFDFLVWTNVLPFIHIVWAAGKKATYTAQDTYV